MFVANGARPVMMRPAERLVTVRRFLFVGLEPVRSFPAELFTERTAQVTQAVIGGGEPQVAPREAFLAGKMDVVILTVSLDRARRGVILAVVVGAEAAYIQPPHIPLGMPIDNPLGHNLADAARACQSMGAERARHPEALDRGRTQQIFTVGREAFGTVEQFSHFRIFHGGDTLDGIFHQWREALPIFG